MRLHIVNATVHDQRIAVFYDGEKVDSFSIPRDKDTVYFYESFDRKTSVEFSSLKPDTLFVPHDVDHWFGMEHEFTVMLHEQSIQITPYVAPYWEKRYKYSAHN